MVRRVGPRAQPGEHALFTVIFLWSNLNEQTHVQWYTNKCSSNPYTRWAEQTSSRTSLMRGWNWQVKEQFISRLTHLLATSHAGELLELPSSSCIFAFWFVSNSRIFEVLYSRGKIPTAWDQVLKRLSTGPTCAKVRVSHVTHHAKSVRSRMC